MRGLGDAGVHKKHRESENLWESPKAKGKSEGLMVCWKFKSRLVPTV